MTNRIIVFTTARPYLASLVAVVALVALLGAVSMPAQTYFAAQIEQYELRGYLAVSVMAQVVLTVVALALMSLSGVRKPTDFGREGLGKGMLLGWFGLLFAAFMLTFNLVAIPSEYLIVPQVVPLILVLLSAFMTGVFEEVLVRGLALNILLRSLGDTKKGVLSAVLFSSLMFGVAHLVNIRSIDDLLPVSVQVLGAIMIGVFFAALYLRVKTLWVPIIVHALIDLATFITLAVVSPEGLKAVSESQTEDTLTGNYISLLITLPFLIIGLVLLRKHQVATQPDSVATPTEPDSVATPTEPDFVTD